MVTSDLESMLGDDLLSKPLSVLYKALLPSVHVGMESLRSTWWMEALDINDEDWEALWDYPFSQLVAYTRFI